MLVVRTLSDGPGLVVRPGDYVLFDVAAKVWAGDRLVLDTFANHQPQGLPLPAGLPAWRHLAGQRVGSRVLEVVPPRDGFGRRGNASVNVTGTILISGALPVDMFCLLHETLNDGIVIELIPI